MRFPLRLVDFAASFSRKGHVHPQCPIGITINPFFRKLIPIKNGSRPALQSALRLSQRDVPPVQGWVHPQTNEETSMGGKIENVALAISIAASAAAFSVPAIAQTSNQELKQQIDSLRDQLEKLQQQLEQVSKQPPAVPAAPSLQRRPSAAATSPEATSSLSASPSRASRFTREAARPRSTATSTCRSMMRPRASAA